MLITEKKSNVTLYTKDKYFEYSFTNYYLPPFGCPGCNQ